MGHAFIHPNGLNSVVAHVFKIFLSVERVEIILEGPIRPPKRYTYTYRRFYMYIYFICVNHLPTLDIYLN